MPLGTDWSPRFAIFGDMGNTNAQSLPRLQEETMLGYYDAILHVGDFAYNMDDVNFFLIFELAMALFKLIS
jgi:hypothetical protein